MHFSRQIFTCVLLVLVITTISAQMNFSDTHHEMQSMENSTTSTPSPHDTNMTTDQSTSAPPSSANETESPNNPNDQFFQPTNFTPGMTTNMTGMDHFGMPGMTHDVQDSSTSTTFSSLHVPSTIPSTSSSSTTLKPDNDSKVVIYPEETSNGNVSGNWKAGKFPPPGISGGPTGDTSISSTSDTKPFFFPVNHSNPESDDKTKYDTVGEPQSTSGTSFSNQETTTDDKNSQSIPESFWKRIETLVEVTQMSTTPASTPHFKGVTWGTPNFPHGTGIGSSKEVGKSQPSKQNMGSLSKASFLFVVVSIFLNFV